MASYQCKFVLPFDIHNSENLGIPPYEFRPSAINGMMPYDEYHHDANTNIGFLPYDNTLPFDRRGHSINGRLSSISVENNEYVNSFIVITYISL